MKPRFFSPERWLTAISSILLGAVLFASAAGAPTNVPAAKGSKATASSNAAPAEVEILQSVFTVPANEKQGKDPFFPRSKRPYAYINIPQPTNQQVSVIGDLKITGISGGEDRPLVIINNFTFGEGDTAEIVVGGRRIRIQCLEIDLSAGTAVIQHGGERRVLRFQRPEK